MRFENSILKTIVEKLKLRRMRFKVDPAISNLEDFDGNTSYEGYVLNENEGMLNILVVDPNNQVRQTAVFAKGLDVLSDNLNEFKRNLVKILMDRVSPQVLEQIQNAPTFDEAELLAKNNGANDDDIKNAYRKFNTESTIDEETLARKAARKAGELAKGAVKGTAGAVADVALGKDRAPGIKGLTGIMGLGSRIGSTLSKLGTKGKGDFEFAKAKEKEPKSIYHEDKPRNGEKFIIEYEDEGVPYQISGTVSGEKTFGTEKYVQIKNVKTDPETNISSVLVNFKIQSRSANFIAYNRDNKIEKEFQSNLEFDKRTNTWIASSTKKPEKQQSIYHEGRPKNNENFEIDYMDTDGPHIITGTVSGEKSFGSERYIQLTKVKANPAFANVPKIGSILVGFNIKSKKAEFYLYNDENKLQKEFQAKLQFDKNSKTWEVTDNEDIKEKNEEKSAEYADQTKEDQIVWKGKTYVKVAQEFKSNNGITYQPAVLSNNKTQNPVNIPLK